MAFVLIDLASRLTLNLAMESIISPNGKEIRERAALNLETPAKTVDTKEE